MMMSVACMTAGLILLITFRDFRNSGTNVLAGFMLGTFLLIIGVWNVLANSKQTVVVDSKAHCIIVEDSYIFATKRRIIPFADVSNINIGYLGKKSNGVTWYYLVLKLSNGKNYPLFSPGYFYEGGTDRATVESWKRRLVGYLDQQGKG